MKRIQIMMISVCVFSSQVSQLAGVVRDVCKDNCCSLVLDIGSGLVSAKKAENECECVYSFIIPSSFRAILVAVSLVSVL